MEKYKINWISGFKGCAAILVFIHHFFLFFYPAFCNGSIESSKTSNFLDYKISQTNFNILGWGGSVAVSFFYIISGFLIAYGYYVKNNKNIKSKNIFERYLKLALPMFFTLLIVFLIIKSKIFRTDSLLNEYSLIGFNDYFASSNFTILDVIKESFFKIFWHASSYLNPPFWTMQSELFFSIILMMYLKMFGNQTKRGYIYAITLILSINSYFFAFVIGSILCDLLFNKKDLLEKINKLNVKFILLLVGLYLCSFTYVLAANGKFLIPSFTTFDTNVIFHNIGAALIVLFLILSKIGQKLFSLKPIVKLGDISFELYAFHWVLLQSISKFVVCKLFYHMKYFYSCLISLGITTIILILMSIYFNKYIKKWTNFIVKKCSSFIFKDEQEQIQ